jgi:proteasome beta subunit
LRFSFRDGYHGSSFAELLGSQYPHLIPDLRGISAAAGEVRVQHGTTVIGLRFTEGVLVAGDRLATMNYMVGSRDIQKVYATDDHSLMAIAGAAGPSIEMARLLRVQFEHYEKIEGQSLELEGKANTLSGLIRQNLPAAMQGLVVVPIFAGFDRRRGVGRVWKYEITGARFEEQDYDSVGSGSIFAKESLKKTFRSGAPREDAVRMVLEALKDAADEDRGTGGVDLERNIYPTIKTCTARGIETIPDDEIARLHRDVLERRRRPVEA